MWVFIDNQSPYMRYGWIVEYVHHTKHDYHTYKKVGYLPCCLLYVG